MSKGPEGPGLEGVERILVRATNWVGDAVMTLPALEALRENFPRSLITVLATPWVAPLFMNHPVVDDVMILEKGEGLVGNLLRMARIIRAVRRRRFDLAVLFQNAFEAALIAFLGRVPVRVGYNTDARGFLLTHPVPRDASVLGVHQVEYYLSLLHGVGWRARGGDPCLRVPAEEAAWAERALSSAGVGPGVFLVGLGPGAAFGEAKRWPADRFAGVADRAATRWGARVLLFGSPKEAPICRELKERMENPPVDFCGSTSLTEAMALMARCGLFVTNDSGLMHMAAALGVPTVAVFGSTDPEATGPRGPRTAVVRREVACAPCLRRSCPTDFSCMLSVTEDDVWEAMERLKKEIQ
ncbi:MAG: lipopolysaccharide heptosyltransferase II [Deltaproteobacteria bacterium]|nr:lipopolysaccharide heptosyltransferase II [Deltaproteobacteria bacterium]MBW1951113.1 lipopolysaccharide heptosyltransferase II [Deltaproteobacteria bacterium]MBW2009296.1 lipopolysaccharide heptosyltransferase II [Deltaproteobacteria bacterium]